MRQWCNTPSLKLNPSFFCSLRTWNCMPTPQGFSISTLCWNIRKKCIACPGTNVVDWQHLWASNHSPNWTLCEISNLFDESHHLLHQTIKLTQESGLRGAYGFSHLLKGFSVQQCISTNTSNSELRTCSSSLF